MHGWVVYAGLTSGGVFVFVVVYFGLGLCRLVVLVGLSRKRTCCFEQFKLIWGGAGGGLAQSFVFGGFGLSPLGVRCASTRSSLLCFAMGFLSLGA